MKKLLDVALPIFLYGLVWGLYHFWGYKKLKTKVLMHPNKHSPYTINFFTNLTRFRTAILAFVTGIVVGGFAYILSALFK
jgi:hypothetical protein